MIHQKETGVAQNVRKITLEMKKRVKKSMVNIAKFAKMVVNYFVVIIVLEHII